MMENALARVWRGAAALRADSASHTALTKTPEAQRPFRSPDDSPFAASGKTAQIVARFISCPGGLTSNDVWPVTTRLAGVVHHLRLRGLKIGAEMEPHEGGRHARYRLVTCLKPAPSEQG